MSESGQPETLAAAVVGSIAEAVIAGRLRPGAPLREVQLARAFRTSRGTIREALHQLADLGLVDIQPYRGAVVSELSPTKATEIFSLRGLLESYAARLALERDQVDDAAMADIVDGFEALERVADPRDMLEATRADMEFHRRISSRCGHGLLLEHLSSLEPQTRRFVFSVRLYDAIVEGLAESHRPILDALERRDPDELEAAVADHIALSGARLLDRMAHLEVGDTDPLAELVMPSELVQTTRGRAQ